MRINTVKRLLAGSVLSLVGVSSVMAGNLYHALEFELQENELPSSNKVALIELTDDDGTITGYAFLPIDEDMEEFDFVVEIPTDGLMQGDSGSSAEGIVAVEGDDIDDFNFKSVDWPSVSSSVWDLEDDEFGEVNEVEITVTIPSGLNNEEEGSVDEDDLSMELSLDGSGAIETLDWSSHQRAQADEEEKDVTEMFNNPDGVGRVQEADNPQGLEFVLVRVEFETFPDSTSGPNKPHSLNMDTRQNEANHYGDFLKSVSYIWSQEDVDLVQYLKGSDNGVLQEIFQNELQWKIKGPGYNNDWQDEYKMDLGDEPSNHPFHPFSKFEITVGVDGADAAFDYLIISVVPESTQDDFGDWYQTENNDRNWLNELPALYSSIIVGQPPDDPEGDNCDVWFPPTVFAPHK